MKLNKAPAPSKVYTHEGAVAAKDSVENKLRKALMTCMLWENTHYESGVSIADRIADYVPKLSFEKVAQIAIEAKEESKLRHAPLLIAAVSVANFDGKKVGDLIERLITRPDEMGELIKIYWSLPGNKKMIPRQMKLGIARAYKKFNEYSLAKYNSGSAEVKLRDVVFMCKIRTFGEQGARTARLVNKQHIPEKYAKQYQIPVNVVGLASPETWENRLSRGEDKKTVFTELIVNKKLGALALLRNLRNMQEAGVNSSLIRSAFETANVEKVLPFQFVSAAEHAPQWKDELNTLMLKCLSQFDKFEGKTVIVVDVSGSMSSMISGKSTISRQKAASATAALIREVCNEVVVYATGDRTFMAPNSRGLNLVDDIAKLNSKCGYGGIYLTPTMNQIYKEHPDAVRIIVLTDEQDCGSGANAPANAKAYGKYNYLINLASYENGVNFSKWTQINGWSENVINYIQVLEQSGLEI
jgi:60 kDa SS-A/Ro ribonucleoprotein